MGIASAASAAGSSTMDNDPAFSGTTWTDKDANGAEVFIKESNSSSYSSDDRIGVVPEKRGFTTLIKTHHYK
ncbi:hypothetical protein [Ammoniphilus sp. YIM 78166]|uniref:hypothetical protein n=1 Tax=Ammoniphilus sp. YIM 78166 TaxID=1644106 RepID=UPI00142FA8E7|nr:hypothetical protein [Ammoniphilus sp. YIM 78166]